MKIIGKATGEKLLVEMTKNEFGLLIGETYFRGNTDEMEGKPIDMHKQWRVLSDMKEFGPTKKLLAKQLRDMANKVELIKIEIPSLAEQKES